MLTLLYLILTNQSSLYRFIFSEGFASIYTGLKSPFPKNIKCFI